jgi:hypothetical protein
MLPQALRIIKHFFIRQTFIENKYSGVITSSEHEARLNSRKTIILVKNSSSFFSFCREII